MSKKLKYLLTYALSFAIIGNLLWAAFYYFIDETASKDYFLQQFATWLIIPRLIFFFILGYFLGYREWKKKNK